MTQRCRGCGGPFVSRDEPFCRRCDERRLEQSIDAWERQWLEDRASVAQWARNVLAEGCLILDTETTGLDGYIVQLAVIDGHGQVLIDTLVQPEAEIEEEAMAVHGISQALVKGAPTFAALHEQLYALLKGRTVAVYNLSFDQDVLLRERHRMGHTPGRRNLYGAHWQDVMIPYSTFVGEPGRNDDYRWQRLPGGDHTAQGDCQATLAVLWELAEWRLPT